MWQRRLLTKSHVTIRELYPEIPESALFDLDYHAYSR